MNENKNNKLYYEDEQFTAVDDTGLNQLFSDAWSDYRTYSGN